MYFQTQKKTFVFLTIFFIFWVIFYIFYTNRNNSLANLYKKVNNNKSLDCKQANSRFLTFPAGHPCLQYLTESQCYDGLVVPRLVHYVIFNSKQFYFYNLLSFLSSYRILKPCFIFVHGNVIPEGQWWNHMLDLIPNLILVKTDVPTEIFQRNVRVVQHQSDVARLRIMMEYGGIYMDTDQIALKSFDPLRNYTMTLSTASNVTVNNAVIIANKNSHFLKIWYFSYKTFQDEIWNYHSCVLPFQLATLFPELIHLEYGKFFDFEKSVYFMFEGVCDWSYRYALHLYYTFQRKNRNVKDFSPEEIKNMNTTFGEVARFIYFGQLPGNRKTKC